MCDLTRHVALRVYMFSGKMWKDNNLLEQLEGLSEHINILSLQTTELNDVKALYYMALIRAH